MQPKVSKGETPNFSKSIMSAIILLYFIGFVIGTALVWIAAMVDIKLGNPLDTSMFVAYAAYLGGPTATAIGFYAWKSKAENVLKISKSLDQNQEVIVNAVSQIGF